jgi:SAM-dependent methyltransferase
MRRFWDERAREDPWFFVDNRLEYGRADEERFWRAGEEAVEILVGGLGAEIGPADRVVEIGCGIGRITRALAARAREVAALDVSEEMLARARQHNGHLANVRWLHGDGESLTGIADASADACVSAFVFQHLPDPGLALGYVREIGRVLRPGGFAALQLSNDPGAHTHRLGARARLRALARRGPRGQGHRAWLGSAVGLDDLEAAAGTAGLEVERVEGAGTLFCCVLLRAGGPA